MFFLRLTEEKITSKHNQNVEKKKTLPSKPNYGFIEEDDQSYKHTRTHNQNNPHSELQQNIEYLDNSGRSGGQHKQRQQGKIFGKFTRGNVH